MPSQDAVDPTIAEADRRAERAKASLLERVELLKHKLTDAKQKLDLPAQIARHPLPAIGVAFALGLAAGFGRKGSPAPAQDGVQRSFRDVLFAAAATFGLRIVREAALSQLSEVARQWWTKQQVAAGQLPASDGRPAGRPGLASFLGH